jgi:hypothetical protein
MALSLVAVTYCRPHRVACAWPVHLLLGRDVKDRPFDGDVDRFAAAASVRFDFEWHVRRIFPIVLRQVTDGEGRVLGRVQLEVWVHLEGHLGSGWLLFDAAGEEEEGDDGGSEEEQADLFANERNRASLGN